MTKSIHLEMKVVSEVISSFPHEEMKQGRESDLPKVQNVSDTVYVEPLFSKYLSVKHVLLKILVQDFCSR